MDFQTVKVEKMLEGILRISVNRPDKMNCLNRQVVSELPKAFELYSKDPQVRVIIIGGEGEKSFIAGADLDEHRKMSTMQSREEYHADFIRFLNMLDQSDKPVIAAVKGYTFGGGNIIAMHCDIVFATHDSTFGQQELRVGLIGGLPKLSHLVGPRNAMDILLTGRIFDAQEAQQIGLINKALPREGFDEFVLDYAKKLTKTPAILFKFLKTSKNMYEKTNLQVAMQYEFELINELYSSNITYETMTAFVEKRKPVYSDKPY